MAIAGGVGVEGDHMKFSIIPACELVRESDIGSIKLPDFSLAPLAQGCPGKIRALSLRKFASEISRKRRLLILSPRRPGGEGRVRGVDEPVRGIAHLTLPPLSAHACVRLSGGASPMRQGPLPLPPDGRRGALANRMTDMRCAVERNDKLATVFVSPDSPAASGAR